MLLNVGCNGDRTDHMCAIWLYFCRFLHALIGVLMTKEAFSGTLSLHRLGTIGQFVIIYRNIQEIHIGNKLSGVSRLNIFSRGNS